jgi:hypothetical protein
MTLQRSGHAYRQGLIAGVVLLCLGPAGARAQSAAGREVTVTAAFDVANAYLLRGINQDDTGVIMWPAADFGLVVTAGGQGGTGRMTVNLGTWNSLHTGAAGLDGLGKLWYQSDFYATFGIGVGGGLKVGAGYVARTSPNNAFPTMMELAFTVGAPAHWVAPYALVAVELQGQLDGGRNKGQYLEIGARPTFGQGVTVAVPARVGLSLGDYYEGLRGDDRFGFFSVGGVATLPLAGRGAPARWNVHGGAEYIWLGDRNQLVLGKQQQVVVSGGLGFTY